MLVITCLCKITSADEEEGRDGKAAKAKRDGASVQRAGKGSHSALPSGFTPLWSPGSHGLVLTGLAWCASITPRHPPSPPALDSPKAVSMFTSNPCLSSHGAAAPTWAGETSACRRRTQHFRPWCSPSSFAKRPPILASTGSVGWPCPPASAWELCRREGSECPKQGSRYLAVNRHTGDGNLPHFKKTCKQDCISMPYMYIP